MSSLRSSPCQEAVSVVRGALERGEVRPLGFDCPACGVVLTLLDPVAYDGRPAPCPWCAALVVPPRVARLEEADPGVIELHPLPGLSARVGERVKMPRAVHRPRRRVDGGDDWAGGVVMSGQR